MIIGVTGYKASGKDTLVSFFEKKGFKHISLSNYLRDILLTQNKEITRENLTSLGNELRSSKGDDYLATLALKDLNNFKGDVIISSIGRVAEIKKLRRMKKFKLIFVDANEKIRFERAFKRSREAEHKSFQSFLKHDKLERKGAQANYREFDNCKKEADFVLENNSSFEEFEKQCNRLMKIFIS